LLVASQSQDGLQCATLSRSLAGMQRRIDEFFRELESATMEHDKRSKEFDERLALVEEGG
jgi:hypothetical protein